VRMNVGGVCKLFRQEVKSMAVGARNIHFTKSMMAFRVMVLLAAKRNWEWHLGIAWTCWMTSSLLLLTKREIRILLKLDIFCITYLYILLFWMRLWRWWWSMCMFPGHCNIILMMLLRLLTKTNNKEK